MSEYQKKKGDAVRILKTALVHAFYPHTTKLLKLEDAEMDVLLAYGPLSALVSQHTQNLEQIIDEASAVAVGSATAHIKQAETIDPFVVDEAMTRWKL